MPIALADSAVPGPQVPPLTTCLSPKHTHIFNSGGDSPVPAVPPTTPATPSALADPLNKHTHSHAYVHRHTNRGLTKTTKGAGPAGNADMVLHHTGRGRKLRYASLSPVHSPTHSTSSEDGDKDNAEDKAEAEDKADTDATASVDSESTWGLLHQVDGSTEVEVEAGTDAGGKSDHNDDWYSTNIFC